MRRCQICGGALEPSDGEAVYCLRCEKIDLEATMEVYHGVSL